jgi:hypothetical protein
MIGHQRKSNWNSDKIQMLRKHFYCSSSSNINIHLPSWIYSDVMVNLLGSNVVNRDFGPRSGQTKDYKIDICCLFAKLVSLRSKSKDWLAWNQDNVSKGSDISICGKFNSTCWSSTKQISSSSNQNISCSRHDTAGKLLAWH